MSEVRKEIDAAMEEVIAENSNETGPVVENEVETVENPETKEEVKQTHTVSDPPMFVPFRGSYKFEGKTYTGIDLAGLETLTAKDMVDAEDWLIRHGIVSALPEMTYEYVSFIASIASGQPIEFFKGLSPKNAIKVKNKVTSFFYGQG